VGAARSGPFNGMPELLTSFSEFERVCWQSRPAHVHGGRCVAQLPRAGVRAFFTRRFNAFVSRIYQPGDRTIRPPNVAARRLRLRSNLTGHAFSTISTPAATSSWWRAIRAAAGTSA